MPLSLSIVIFRRWLYRAIKKFFPGWKLPIIPQPRNDTSWHWNLCISAVRFILIAYRRISMALYSFRACLYWCACTVYMEHASKPLRLFDAEYFWAAGPAAGSRFEHTAWKSLGSRLMLAAPTLLTHSCNTYQILFLVHCPHNTPFTRPLRSIWGPCFTGAHAGLCQVRTIFKRYIAISRKHGEQ